jgi:hypothetical protein
MSFPDELKPFKRYLVQANQIHKVQPLVAYYCRMHAASLIVSQGSGGSVAQQFLQGLVQRLEQDKAMLGTLDKDRDIEQVRNMAESVFDRADLEDRESRADMQTSHAFMTAFVLLDVLQGMMDEEDEDQQGIEEMKRYAMWKAADIAKAIKAGRKPNPGGAVERKIEEEDEVKLPDYMNQEMRKSEESAEPMSPTKAKKILPSKGLNPADAAKMKKLKDIEVTIREGMAAIRFDDVGIAKENIKIALNQLKEVR